MKRCLGSVLLTGLLLIAATAFAQEAGWDLEVPVATGAGDSEEFLRDSRSDPQRWPAGFSYRESSDLELGIDPSHGPQTVGLRFEGVQIPPGSRVAEAAVRFYADTGGSSPVELLVSGHRDANPSPFIQDDEGQGSFDLSERDSTAAEVGWSPEAWQRGTGYLTADLSPIIEELAALPGWSEGGAMVILFRPTDLGAEGHRSAFAFDGREDRAPVLLVRLATEDEPPADDEQGAPEPAAGDAAEDEREPGEEPAEDVPVDAAEGQDQPARPDDATPEPQRQVEEADAPGAPAEPQPEDRPAADERREEAATVEGDAATARVREQARATAREARRGSFRLEQSYPRGVRGNVMLSDYGLGGTVVTLLLDNPVAGHSYSARLNHGSCAGGGRAAQTLVSIEGTRGFGSSLVPLDFEELTGGGYHVGVYRASDGFTRLVGCADLQR